MGVDQQARLHVDDALAAVEQSVSLLGSDNIAVADALGRVTAASVAAAIDVPRFRTAAMDGFAVNSGSTGPATRERAVELYLGKSVPAGTWPADLPPNSAVPISTGAPVPMGADAVIVREAAIWSELGGDRWLRVESPIEAYRNVRLIGEDAQCGAEVVGANTVITPDLVGAFTAFGVEQVLVRRMPRIGLVSTGSELVRSAGALTGSAQLIDSNGPMLMAAGLALGLKSSKIGVVADDPASIANLLAHVLEPSSGDLIVSSGGVSAGDFDLLPRLLVEHGATVVFHGVRMRPGKPVLFALLPDGRPFFGLPGNPVAALVAFRFFVVAAVRAMLGLPREAGIPVALEVEPRIGTTMFLRGRWSAADGFSPIADITLDQRSHVLSSVVQSDHWFRVDAGSDGLARAWAFPKTALLGDRS